jgi:hypothetical protein
LALERGAIVSSVMAPVDSKDDWEFTMSISLTRRPASRRM